MKTLRLIGMTVLAVVMCMNFVSCGDDDDDRSGDAASLIGKWKIEKTNYRGETEEWDGYPYFMVTASNFYFTDETGTPKSENSTYTYDAKNKIINAKYVNGGDPYTITVIKLTDSEFEFQWDDEGIETFYCKKAQ